MSLQYLDSYTAEKIARLEGERRERAHRLRASLGPLPPARPAARSQVARLLRAFADRLDARPVHGPASESAGGC